MNGTINLKLWQGILALVLTLAGAGVTGYAGSTATAEGNEKRLERIERRIIEDMRDIKTEVALMREFIAELRAWTAHLEARLDNVNGRR